MASYRYDPYDSGYRSPTLASRIYTDAMSRLYGLVALGVFTTGGAVLVGHTTGLGLAFYGMGMLGFLVMIALTFGLLIGANAVTARGNTGLGIALYLGFTGIEGIFISPILSSSMPEAIGMSLLLTAGVFVAMSAVGMTTKRDLSRLGPMLFIALIGVIVVSLVNMLLLQSGMLALLINIVALFVFIGLTAWETQHVKTLAQEAAANGDAKAANQVAVLGSIGLYLNVLNIFLILLNLFGMFGSDN